MLLHTCTHICTHRYRHTCSFAGETLWSQDTQPMVYTRLLLGISLSVCCSKWILQMITKALNPLSKSCKTLHLCSESRVEKSQGDSGHKIESYIKGTSSMGPSSCPWSVKGYGWVASTSRGQPPADDGRGTSSLRFATLRN